MSSYSSIAKRFLGPVFFALILCFTAFGQQTASGRETELPMSTLARINDFIAQDIRNGDREGLQIHIKQLREAVRLRSREETNPDAYLGTLASRSDGQGTSEPASVAGLEGARSQIDVALREGALSKAKSILDNIDQEITRQRPNPKLVPPAPQALWESCSVAESKLRDALQHNQFDEAEMQSAAMVSGLESCRKHASLYGDSFFETYFALGQAAFARADYLSAAQYLVESGRTTASPRLKSFGPSMMLASELLRKGYQEPVTKYLEECRLFWKSAAIAGWLVQVKQGSKDVAFAPNASYTW